MKKLLVLSVTFLLVFFVEITSAQNTTKQDTTNSSSMFQGGLWAGASKTATFIGFMGPKISMTVAVSKKSEIEIGLNGVPGLLVKPEIKLGLSAGTTFTFKNKNWKIKPIVGVMFIKTDSWQTMLGVGFMF